MNNIYFSDNGGGQNIAENLSTFSAHIKNVLEILGEVTNRTRFRERLRGFFYIYLNLMSFNSIIFLIETF